MAKRRKRTKPQEENEPNERATAGANGRYDEAKTRDFVERIENLHADIASIMGEALLRCRGVHDDIKIVYQEAKDEAAIPKKALKKVIKARALEQKARAVREDLEAEDQDSFDRIRLALGDLADTPLGAAVLAQTGHTDTSEQPFAAGDDVRPRHLQQA
jgi:uncharacterized protein (UPF0335 family)